MQYKAIVSDFDGTLVGPEKVISEPVAEAIHKFIQQGNIFAIATGRMYHGIVQKQAQRLGLTSLVIIRGGSEIFDPVTNKFVWGKYMNDSDSKAIIDYLKINKQKFYVDKNKTIYTDHQKNSKFRGNIKPLNSLKYTKIPKIGIINGSLSKSDANTLAKELSNKFHYINVFPAYNPRGWGLDITASGATKQIGLLQWAKLSNLKRTEIVGVGDSYNDYPLLTTAGIGVAMGNAIDELKQIADFIAPSQKDNGIIAVIDKYFS